MQTIAGRTFAEMLHRDERRAEGGEGEGSGISCLSNIQLSHPGEPAKSRQLYGRWVQSQNIVASKRFRRKRMQEGTALLSAKDDVHQTRPDSQTTFSCCDRRPFG